MASQSSSCQGEPCAKRRSPRLGGIGRSETSRIEFLVPLKSEEEVGPVLDALRFLYSGKLDVNGGRALALLRQQANFLGIDDCVEACDTAMEAQFSGGSSSNDGEGMLARVLELYNCRDLLPAVAPDTPLAALWSACLEQLARHSDAGLPGSDGAPTKAQLLIWLLGDAVRVANSEPRKDAFAELPADALETLLASDGFATDNEATVLVLLDGWLDANEPEDDVAQRLLHLIRLPQLGSSYLSFLTPHLKHLRVEPAEALFALQYAEASPVAREQLSQLGLYDCSGPRYAGPRQQAVPATGLQHEWRLGRKEVEALAKAAAGSEVKQRALFPAVSSDQNHIFCQGFQWRISVGFHRSICVDGMEDDGGALDVHMCCDEPTGAAQGIAYLPATVVVHRWRGGAKEEGCKVEFEAARPYAYGTGWGKRNALQFSSAASSGQEGSAAGGSVDPLAAWADWLHDGCIMGTLTVYPPGTDI